MNTDLSCLHFRKNFHAWDTEEGRFIISNSFETFLFKDVSLKTAIYQLLNQVWNLNDVISGHVKVDKEIHALNEFIYIA